MKSYVYTYSRSKANKWGWCTHTATVYRVKRNKLVFVGTKTDTFVDEFQLVLMIMKEHKQLPLRAFDRGHSAWTLKNVGLADVQRV